MDKWLAQASGHRRPGLRKELYTPVQRAVVTERPSLLPLYVPADQLAAQKSVRGLGFDPGLGNAANAYDVRAGT